MLEPVESPPHAGELSAAAPLGVAALLAAGAGSRYIAAGGEGSHKLLALVAGRLRGRIGPRVFRAINLASGVAILGFAAWQFATLLR